MVLDVSIKSCKCSSGRFARFIYSSAVSTLHIHRHDKVVHISLIIQAPFKGLCFVPNITILPEYPYIFWHNAL